jgi:hypothetical protein
MSKQTAQLLEAFEALPERKSGFSQWNSCAGRRRRQCPAFEDGRILGAERSDLS